MTVWLDRLARHARSIVLIVAGLLAGGALVTVLGLPGVGWPVYSLGHVGMLLAVPAIGGAYRASLPQVGWLWLGMAFIGFLLGLAVVATTWGHYLRDPGLQEVVLARQVLPIGTYAGVVAWLGMALFGLVAISPTDVPRGGAITLLGAAILIVAAELGLLAAYVWALAIVLAAVGLVWLAPLPLDEVVAEERVTRPISPQAG